ncbi:PEP-CTERM sorting domain-containing protein [Synechocystis sp. PCC 7509]|uniref:PEP-CTERM sorting domain-containing protein n=1 Tax=Synechocystis sp. PCC 7509 TaxID=927677 RepID=UPI0002AC9342|nr:PEP-CTERM sorting domain-containing protein [Synechocystis sp. PCC 7509]
MISVKQLSIATVGIALGLGSIAPVSAASLYQISGLDFTPSDINDSAQVVGENYFWQNGNVTDLNTLAGANNSNVFARAINNNGAIVGGGLTVNEPTTTQTTIPFQAFISDGNTISDLPRNYFCEFSCPTITAEDINDSGTIALIYDFRVGLVQESDGTTTEVLGARQVSNTAINNQDQVVGTGIFSGSGNQGIFAEDGNQTTLIANTSSGVAGVPQSAANDINDSSNIVGRSSTISSTNTVFETATLWTDPTQPGVSLGTLGGENSDATGINNLMQVVGSSFLEDNSTQHAFLWEEGNLIDLNSLIDPGLGWELTSALEINSSGDIIGTGLYNGVQRGFVAKAIPEPSSVLGVLGLGLFGLRGWLKRKK